MNYIKLFETFNSNDAIIEDLKDICVDLEDDGFLFDISVGLGGVIMISIIKGSKYNLDAQYYTYDEISEVVERMRNYMVDYTIDIFCNPSRARMDYGLISFEKN